MTRFTRSRQGGFGYLEIGMAIAGLMALAALAWAVNNYLTGIDTRAHKRGVDETTALYAKRDNAALRDAITAKEAAEKRSRAIEDQRSTDAAAAAKRYQEGLADGKKELDAALARARAGQRLRDPGRTGGAPCVPTGIVPAPGAGGRGGDGQAGGKLPEPAAGVLSGEASDFLIRLTGEANDVVKQLTSCQQALEADRKK